MRFNLSFIAKLVSIASVVVYANAGENFSKYSPIIRNENETSMFSPLLFEVALKLICVQARGILEEEIHHAIALKEDNCTLIDANLEDLFDSYRDSEYLKISNKMFINEGLILQSKFKDVAKTKFNLDVETIDFERNEDAAQSINDWIQQQTNHKITDLISSASLETTTQMVMVNTVYFKDEWVKPFRKYRNEMKVFGGWEHGILNDLDANVLKFYLKNADTFFLMIFPTKGDGLFELENKLLETNFVNIKERLIPMKTKISIPPFKYESSISLKDSLTAIGIHTIFEEDTEWSVFENLSDPVKLSDGFIRAFIEVNENGIEAGAETWSQLPAFGENDNSYPASFIYAIITKSRVLFTGKVIGKK